MTILRYLAGSLRLFSVIKLFWQFYQPLYVLHKLYKNLNANKLVSNLVKPPHKQKYEYTPVIYIANFVCLFIHRIVDEV